MTTDPTAQPIATAAKYRLDTTQTRALSDATRASLAAAARAFEAGKIHQRAVGDGVYVLVRT